MNNTNNSFSSVNNTSKELSMMPSNIQQMVHNPTGWMIPRTSPFSPSARLQTDENHEQSTSNFAIPFNLNDLSMNSTVSSMATGSTRTFAVHDVPELSIRRIEGPHFTGSTTEEPKHYAKPIKTTSNTSPVKALPKSSNVHKSPVSRTGGSPRAFRKVQGFTKNSALNTTMISNMTSQSQGHVEYRVTTLFGRATVKRVVVSPTTSAPSNVSPSKMVLSPLSSNRIPLSPVLNKSKQHLLHSLLSSNVMNDTYESGGTIPEVEQIYQDYQQQIMEQREKLENFYNTNNNDTQVIEAPIVVRTMSPNKLISDDNTEQIVAAVDEEIDFDALYDMEYGKSLSPRLATFEPETVSVNISNISAVAPPPVPNTKEMVSNTITKNMEAETDTIITSMTNKNTKLLSTTYQPPATVTERISRYRPSGKADPVTLYKQLVANNDIDKNGLHTKKHHTHEIYSKTPSPRSKVNHSKLSPPNKVTVTTIKSPSFDLLDDTDNTINVVTSDNNNNAEDTATRYRMLVALMNMAGTQHPPLPGEPGYAEFVRFLAYEGDNNTLKQLIDQYQFNLPTTNNTSSSTIPNRYTNEKTTMKDIKPINATLLRKKEKLISENIPSNSMNIMTPSPTMNKKSMSRKPFQSIVTPPPVKFNTNTNKGTVSNKQTNTSIINKQPNSITNTQPIGRPSTAQSDTLSASNYASPSLNKQDHIYRSRFMRLH